MKHMFLLAALLLASQLGLAQTLPPATGPAALVIGLATPDPDTVAAIHRLFAARRQQLTVLLLGTAAAEVAGQVVVGSTVPAGGIIDARAIDQFFVALLALPVSAGEVLFFAQYNEKHEQQVLADFEAHQLSRHLKRRLKAKYFR